MLQIKNVVEKDVINADSYVDSYNDEIISVLPFKPRVEEKNLVLIDNGKEFGKLYKAIYHMVKRIFDFILSLCALVVLSPLLLIVCLAIKIETKGPAIFTQMRIGKNGKLFKLYKFRTMVMGADEKLKELLQNDKEARMEYKINKKLKNDPRITKVGKFLRNTSIDELPQLLNVLKGDMSLIGPRPYLPREKEDMVGYYDYIIQNKPGITGLWQNANTFGTVNLGQGIASIETAVLEQRKSNLPIVVDEINEKARIIKEVKRKLFFAIKRFFDLCCSLIGLVFLLPVALLTKIAYVLTGDTKSIFYKQKRIGKNGKLIYIYKFRSMIHNADEVLKELLKDPKYKKEWDLNQKFEHDPRITKIGNILRKTSLDELPQLINVLKGDMSMIGPRPLVEGELDAHNGDHKIYESVRPGISGWWAANGRSATTYVERLELEYYYCENCSLILDIKCFFLTIVAVVFKKGAK